MTEFFLQRGVRCASVHSGPSSAPRHQSIDALRSGELEVIFTVDIFNEGLDVPEIDTVLMLRPTESPVIFLQQLGRGLRIQEGKQALGVIDFIGNHRSFLLKPRTLLSLGRREPPTTLQVLAALESKEFGLPEGCSVDYDLTVVEMLKALSRTSSRDAIEEYCRAYMAEEGLRPTAAQTFRAGHDPAAVTGTYGNWFNFLRAIDLLGEREAAVVDAFGDTLRAIQVESITKSYKLITIRALLHEGALRTGDDVANNAEVSRRLLLADPRLAREVPLKEFPDLAGASQERWANYWRKWPIAHLTGTGPDAARATKLFRLDGDRIVPTFVIDEDLGDVFDAMAAELIEYRLTSYLLNKEKATIRSWTCRLAYTDGHPVIRLDRRQSPDLPTAMSSSSRTGSITAPPSRRVPLRSPRGRMPRATPCPGCCGVGLARRPATQGPHMWSDLSKSTARCCFGPTIRLEQISTSITFRFSAITRSRVARERSSRGVTMRPPRSPLGGRATATSHHPSTSSASRRASRWTAEPIRSDTVTRCCSSGSPAGPLATTSTSP